MKKYISLHNHTTFSVLDGVMKVSQFVKKAKEFKMEKVAITDHGSISNIIQFESECSFEGIKPIFGCEFYINDAKDNSRKRNHIVVLAKNYEGWKQLLKLNRCSFEDNFYYKPRITHDVLLENCSNLIVLSACILSKFADFIVSKDDKEFVKLANQLNEATFNNFYFELIFNHLEFQKEYNHKLVMMAKRLNIPIVITNDVHYIKKEDYILRNISRCIQYKKTLEQQKKDDGENSNVIPHMWFKTADEIYEMNKSFEYNFDENVFDYGFENTIYIADMVEDFEIKLKEVNSPKFCSTHEEAHELLVKKACNAIELYSEKFNTEDEMNKYFNRLQYELDVVDKSKFSNYFLVIADIIEFCNANGIYYGAGRGSGVGSLISFLLRISKIDPVKYGLYFERFLTVARKDPPDIDIDFDANRRDEIEVYLKKKYGDKNVVHVISFGKFGTKGIIRDIGRTYGLNVAMIDKIAKFVEEDKNIIEEVKRFIKENNEKNVAICLFIENNFQLFEYAEQLRGNIRHYGLHASGTVVTDAEGINLMPINRVHDNIVCGLQEGADEREISKMGFIKLDILGLAACSIIKDTIELVQKYRGINLCDIINDFDFTTKEAKGIFSLFNKGDCEGVFQFSSDGIKRYLAEVRVKTFSDLTAVNALYRPATLISGAAREFVERRNGNEEVKYIDERVKYILEPTFGVIVFQEQILELLKVLGGFNLEEAEEIRYSFKLLHKGVEGRTVDRIEKHSQIIVERCIQNGMNTDGAIQIYNTINKYSNYSFNLSHATAYAFLAYQTMWLKLNYTLEFYTALLNNHRDDTEKIARYVQDANSHGIGILHVHINKSKVGFVIEGKTIRKGFDQLHGIGKRVAAEIVEHQNYENKEHFLNTVNKRIVNKRALKILEENNIFLF